MSEKRFLNCILFEGIVLTILGLSMMILPKLTGLTFGVMASIAFITYGIYKIISSIFNREYASNFLLNLLIGFYLAVVGILLLFVPKISLLWLIALIGVYFIIDGILSSISGFKVKNLYNFAMSRLVVSVIVFIVGLIILLGLPFMSLWVVITFSALTFMVKGASKIIFSEINKIKY